MDFSFLFPYADDRKLFYICSLKNSRVGFLEKCFTSKARNAYVVEHRKEEYIWRHYWRYYSIWYR